MRRLLLPLVALLAAAPAAAAVELGSPLGSPIVFRPLGETRLLVAGLGPYRGTIEVRRSSNGLTVINETDLESYVMGLAEVPGSWPMDALKAQAVAARTYVLWERERGAWKSAGYDVCATVACQVYAGALAERGERGKRWVQAVRETRGEVLLHDDEPALARYHASSGGRTIANDVVFPSSGRRPYLQAVSDPDDRVSPLHRWTVDFTREALQNVLRAAIDLEGTIVEIETDEEARRAVVRTEGGETTLVISRFRRLVSEHAAKLYPDRYPGLRADGRLMPVTLPSSRFRVVRDGDDFRFEGRGYGHGVGMSQWGARGRAERGQDYREILAVYYGGLRPQRWTGSTRIRVGLRRSTDDAGVSGNGPFRVTSGPDGLADSTLGSWTVLPGPSRTIRVRPPVGHELPLVLSGVRSPATVRVPGEADHARVRVDFVVPKAARVDATLRLDDRRVATSRGLYEAGSGRLVVEVANPGDLPSEARYRLELTAFDGTGRATKARTVRIERDVPAPVVPAAVAVLLLLAAAAALVWRQASGGAAPPKQPEHLDQSSAIPVLGHRSPGPHG